MFCSYKRQLILFVIFFTLSVFLFGKELLEPKIFNLAPESLFKAKTESATEKIIKGTPEEIAIALEKLEPGTRLRVWKNPIGTEESSLWRDSEKNAGWVFNGKNPNQKGLLGPAFFFKGSSGKNQSRLTSGIHSFQILSESSQKTQEVDSARTSQQTILKHLKTIADSGNHEIRIEYHRPGLSNDTSLTSIAEITGMNALDVNKHAGEFLLTMNSEGKQINFPSHNLEIKQLWINGASVKLDKNVINFGEKLVNILDKLRNYAYQQNNLGNRRFNKEEIKVVAKHLTELKTLLSDVFKTQGASKMTIFKSFNELFSTPFKNWFGGRGDNLQISTEKFLKIFSNSGILPITVMNYAYQSAIPTKTNNSRVFGASS